MGTRFMAGPCSGKDPPAADDSPAADEPPPQPAKPINTLPSRHVATARFARDLNDWTSGLPIVRISPICLYLHRGELACNRMSKLVLLGIWRDPVKLQLRNPWAQYERAGEAEDVITPPGHC